MTEKFQWMQERYNELSEAVSQPEIIADTARWQRLLKEHAQLEPAVQAWQRYQQLLTQQTEAEEMLNDPELAPIAQTELHELTRRRADMEQELRLLLLPIVVGISYEFNRLVGRHDNWLTRALSAPGMWLQYLTTNEPDDSMIEVGIEALRQVLPEQEGADRW